VVLLGGIVRLLAGAFRRRRIARRGGPPAGRRPVAPLDRPTVHAIPDEEFWAGLKAETTQWIGGRR
jgi:hypothetical protein